MLFHQYYIRMFVSICMHIMLVLLALALALALAQFSRAHVLYTARFKTLTEFLYNTIYCVVNVVIAFNNYYMRWSNLSFYCVSVRWLWWNIIIHPLKRYVYKINGSYILVWLRFSVFLFKLLASVLYIAFRIISDSWFERTMRLIINHKFCGTNKQKCTNRKKKKSVSLQRWFLEDRYDLLWLLYVWILYDELNEMLTCF